MSLCQLFNTIPHLQQLRLLLKTLNTKTIIPIAIDMLIPKAHNLAMEGIDKITTLG